MAPAEQNRGIQSPIEQARDFFHPENMGFTPIGSGWQKDIPGVGTVVFEPLGWEHLSTKVRIGKWHFRKGSAFELVSRAQQKVFKMRSRDAAPPVHLGNIDKRGGSVIVAYKKNPDGLDYKSWLGFGIVEGGDDKKAISEFIGVRDGFRDKKIAPHIRLLQMHDAIEKGKTKFQLEMGPLRGRMANQSIRILGGRADEFVLAKYRGIKYRLYGSDTEDRIKVTFDLLDARTQAKMRAVALGSKFGEGDNATSDINDIPLVTGVNIEQLLPQNSTQTGPDRLRYEIPDDADNLGFFTKRAWRREMTKVFQALLTHEKSYIPDESDGIALTGEDRVVFIGKTTVKKDYTITDFVTEVTGGQRRNFYIFTRNDLLTSQAAV